MKPLFALVLTLLVVAVCGYVAAAAEGPALKPGQSFKDCAGDCPEMVVIPAGSFTMGSPQAEAGRQSNEAPRHNVTIAKPFAVSKFQVTFAEWDACAAHGDCSAHVDDRGWGRNRQPVINVSWNDAQHYVTWLSNMTGKTYRCSLNRSTSTRRAPALRRPIPGETTSAAIMPIALAAAAGGTLHKPLRSARSRRTSSVSVTWLAMSGSGSRTA
jgi:hypothetical protein